MDDSIFTEETFLEASIGNFADCVENIIYQYQRYVNILYLDIPNLYTDLKKNTSVETQKILSFISSEQENLLIMKGIIVAIESVNLLARKYDAFRVQIQQNKDSKYYFSPEAYDFTVKYLNDLDIRKLKFNAYDKTFKGQSSNFLQIMKERVSHYESYNFKPNYEIAYTSESVTMVLDNICMTILNVLNQLKDLAESTTDLNSIFNIIHIIIDILVLGFTMTKTVGMTTD